MEGTPTFAVIAVVLVVLVVAFGYFASQQPQKCDPRLGVLIQSMQDNVTNLNADLRLTPVYSDIEQNITRIAGNLDRAYGSFGAGDCNSARQHALAGYVELDAVAKYAASASQTEQ